MIEYIKLFFDIVIPRFITEEVALRKVAEGEYEIICSLCDAAPLGETYDATTTVRYFNCFGIAFFPKQVGNIKKY